MISFSVQKKRIGMLCFAFEKLSGENLQKALCDQKHCRTPSRNVCHSFVCKGNRQRSKEMIYFLQTPNRSGHSFTTVNSFPLNIYGLVGYEIRKKYFCCDISRLSNEQQHSTEHINILTHHCLLCLFHRHVDRFLCRYFHFVHV